jgi:hypothetical protein
MYRQILSLPGARQLALALRGQSVAGATVPQIATFTGLGRNDVEAILDTHYLGRDSLKPLFLKLEARTKL